MQKHAAIGADTLATCSNTILVRPFLRMGEQVARSHHEKWNGSGYPAGLKGELIRSSVVSSLWQTSTMPLSSNGVTTLRVPTRTRAR